jgi:hypothetical protein
MDLRLDVNVAARRIDSTNDARGRFVPPADIDSVARPMI